MGSGPCRRSMPIMLVPMTEYSFRVAAHDDIQAITDIYNAAVIRGGASADLTPRTLEQRQAWVDSHHDPYAVFVTLASTPNGGERVIGFSALSVFYDRAGYDGVADLAYYIDPQWQGRGVGTFTLSELLDECRNRHMRKACGIIFADNIGSIALMRHFGFTRFGLMPQAATDSTGTMRDMSYWYLDL